MERKVFLWLSGLFVFSAFIKLGGGVLTVKPSTTEALIGDQIVFNCSTSVPSSEIQWFHYPIKANPDRQLVFGYDQLQTDYKRFEIEKNSTTGVFNLIIPSVTVNDAGKYECQDEYGRGDKSSAQLIVLDVLPVCSSPNDLKKVIGSNNCGIPSDQLLFICSVQYKGNEMPLMNWRKVGDQEIIHGHVSSTSSSNVFTYNFTTKGDAVTNGSSFECFPSRAQSKKSSCKTDSVTIVSKTASCEECSCKTYIDAIVCIILIPMIIGVAIAVVLYTFVFRKMKQQEKAKGIKEQKHEKHMDAIFSINFIPFLIGAAVALYWYLKEYRPKVKQGKVKLPDNVEEDKLFVPNEDGNSRQLENELENLRKKYNALVDQINATEDDKSKALVQMKEEAEKQQRKLNNDLQKKIKENNSLQKKIQEDAAKIQEDAAKIQADAAKILELEQHLYPADHVEYLDKPSLVYKIETAASKELKKAISGMTVLGKSLFISHDTTPAIEVYDSTTYVFQHKIPIPKITDPLDLTSYNKISCLFVIGQLESPGECSQIVKMDSKGKLISDWPSGGKLGRLSSSESSVIVCLHDKLLIQEFHHEGELIRTVRLSPAAGLINPWHAIKVSSMHFVVCHGDEKDQLNRVCVVNFDGNIIKECAKWEKINIKSRATFAVPICLLEDKERSILVVDRDNRRIILLNSILRYERKLVEKDVIPEDYFPVRISFDETGNRLFVAANKYSSKTANKGLLLVFNVK